MGLDITAYRKLAPAPQAELDSDGSPVDWEKFHHFSPAVIDWTEQNWPGHSGDVKPGVYSAEETHGFRAGSYSGYNWWRDHLSQFAQGKPAKVLWEGDISGPFAELIHFADNEGVIGPAVSAKLAKDFADFEPKAADYAATIGTEGKYWLQSYQNWKRAFEMAADNGAVDFH